MKSCVYFLVSVFFLAACAGTKTLTENTEKQVTTAINMQAGGAWGGFIEDSELDAISGATPLQFSFGVHPEIHIKNHIFESGLDYVNFNQTLTYNDNEVFGDRTYNYGQLRIPVTYNFKLFKTPDGSMPLLYLKLGVCYGYQLYTSDESTNTYLPAYSFKKSSFGPYFGISSAPININYKWRAGLYLDFFRGTKVYEDSFNSADDVGNMSYLKFGILFRYKDDKSLH